MGRACQCDICGKLYEIPMSVPDLKLTRYRHPYGENRLDLCNECQKKLEKFVSGDKGALE